MILNSITLHNFMSYADAVLDLNGVDVACLGGANGAGKSALLDAITWCLWENARSSSDELIKLGEKEMWVDITFAHESQRYRVRRCRHKSSSRSGTKTVSKGTLELQIFHKDTKTLVSATSNLKVGASKNSLAACAQASTAGRSNNGAAEPEGLSGGLSGGLSEGSWRSLTSGSMRETQSSICNLLRMNFETFVNSVYLRQGKADEFTTRSPSDRKQVLAEILGLSYFDRLQEKSKEKAKELRTRSDYLEASLIGKSDLERQFQQANLDLQSARLMLTALTEEAAQVTQELESIDSKCRQQALLEQKHASNGQQAQRLGKDFEQLSKQLEELQGKLVSIECILSQKAEIEEALTRFNELKIESECLDLKAMQLQELTAAKLDQQTTLAKIRSKLEYEFGGAQSTLDEMELRIVRLTHDTADGATLDGAFLAYRELVKEEASMAAKQELFSKLNNRVNELQGIITESRIHLEADVGQKELKIEELEKLVASETILLERKSQLEASIACLEQSEIEFELVEQTGLEIKLKLGNARLQISDLKRTQRENEEKIKELHRQQDSSICPLCSAFIVDRAAVVDCYRRANAEADNQISRLEHDMTLLDMERLELRKKYTQLRAQLEGRQQLDVQIGHFNEKLSTIARARESLEITKDETRALTTRIEKHDFAQLERESLIAIKAEIYKMEFDPVVHSNLQAQLRSQRGIEARHSQHKRDVAELERLMKEAPVLRENTQKLSDQLISESYGDEIRDTVRSLQQQMNELAFDRTRHELVRKELALLLPNSELFRDLQRALNEEPNLRQSILDCAEMIANKQEQKRLLEQEIEEIELLLQQMPVLQTRLSDMQSLAQDLALKRDEYIKTVAVGESSVHRLTGELALIDERASELNRLRQELDDYSFLAEAFGKKGIQAVIIENAIPEIEVEANKILSRLSENTMHIGLVTQYKTKSGSMNETLDLLIGDEIGTRNYELFSGGEAFKVNFAVRVALSKLLARRSGARLQTLIIDEGFGSQDEASRERLVRAIRAIQTDFARIIVITHMADIKEMFPKQIQVKKINGSSRLQFAY